MNACENRLPLAGTFRSRLLTVLTALGVLLVAGTIGGASPARADDVSDLLALTNSERTARGLAPLRLVGDLSSLAQAHTAVMASTNRLFHNPDLATQVTNWKSLAENVGYAGSVSAVHSALMNSSGHRANILGPYEEIGLGVVRSGTRVWVTEVFRTPLVRTASEPAPAPLPVCSTPQPAAGAVTVSVRRTGYWHLRGSLSNGAADGCFPFGDPGDVPVTGDWDGNGSKTPGVFRPSTGTWYLSNDVAGRAVHAVFRFASPGDIPVAGDWNGSGTDGIGVFRPATGTWYLRNSLSTGIADRVVRYGSPGDVPVVGDWNNDRVDTLGIFRPSLGQWHLSNSFSGWADGVFRYGSPGDVPVVGDWNRSGTDTLGVFRGGLLYLTNRFESGMADNIMRFGSPGDVPVIGQG
jgi:hypothetical protein